MSRVPLPLLPDPPREIQIEVTGACNLRCRMCLVRYRPALPREAGSLSFEAFQRIIGGLPELATVTLQGLGEPLLAPDLLLMVEHAKARRLRVGFNTNGTLLHRHVAERLVDLGLDWLCVSIDGATAATYESIRDGASFERLERNVRGLVEIMQARGAALPELSIVLVAMRRNVRELPDMVRLAKDWGIPKLFVQNLSHSFSDTDPAGDYREIRDFSAAEALWEGEDREASEAFAAAARLAAEIGVELRLPPMRAVDPDMRKPGEPGCDWPWQSAYVRHDEKVQPCCMLMGADRAILGDAGKTTFQEVWHGEEYTLFRQGLISGTPHEVCRGCSTYRRVF